tara:strand:+ start:227 stop:391 length:165 start_codon:yes stop_codon:yes gene_type:complete
MIILKYFALAVSEIGLRPEVLIAGAVFASLFIISFGWITRGKEKLNYGRFQKRN